MRKIIGFIFSFQFSKLLIVFETSLVFMLTMRGLDIAELCVINQYSGSLPWITTMVTAAWGAYAVSSAFYYSKSKAEQLKKIEMTGSEYSSDVTSQNNGCDGPTI